jgi:hypothetical protein
MNKPYKIHFKFSVPESVSITKDQIKTKQKHVAYINLDHVVSIEYWTNPDYEFGCVTMINGLCYYLTDDSFKKMLDYLVTKDDQ